MVVVYYVCECQTMLYCFVGKNFVVRLSTTKTTKILPPEKYPLYGIYTCTCMYVHVHVHDLYLQCGVGLVDYAEIVLGIIGS